MCVCFGDWHGARCCSERCCAAGRHWRTKVGQQPGGSRKGPPPHPQGLCIAHQCSPCPCIHTTQHVRRWPGSRSTTTTAMRPIPNAPHHAPPRKLTFALGFCVFGGLCACVHVCLCACAFLVRLCACVRACICGITCTPLARKTRNWACSPTCARVQSSPRKCLTTPPRSNPRDWWVWILWSFAS